LIKREKVKNISPTILRIEDGVYVTRDTKNTPMKNYRGKQRVKLLEKWAEE
jgi:hypothetical protein